MQSPDSCKCAVIRTVAAFMSPFLAQYLRLDEAVRNQVLGEQRVGIAAGLFRQCSLPRGHAADIFFAGG